MKVIIAGGRHFYLCELHYEWLDKLHAKYRFTEVISGCASGVDTCGELWAVRAGLPVKKFPAKWEELGASAGPVRNQAMARYAGLGCCILFPGGKGTANMRTTAKRFMLEVIEYPVAMPC